LFNKKGFTLLEIVIALAIFAIGLVGLLSLFPVGFQSAKKASDLTQATIYAQEKMEELKQSDFDSISDSSGTFSDSRFSWDLATSSVSTGLKKLELTVSWTERGKNYNEEFVTYVADLTP
jgi:general secretion pathway protein I